MRFCPWYPIEVGADRAPATPGVLQVKIGSGLLDYPTGKSAMVYYAAARDVRAEVIAFARERARPGWLCRHTIEMSAAETEDVEALLARLLRDFRARFGSAPRLPHEAGRG